MLLMIAVLAAWPTPWPPLFHSLALTNKSLQSTFEAHPPLKDWLHLVLEGTGGAPKWANLDEMVTEYMTNTKRALFLNDLATIHYEEKLRKGLYARELEVLRLKLGNDPDLHGWETQKIKEAKKQLSTLKASRSAMDPSGGTDTPYVATRDRPWDEVYRGHDGKLG